MTRFRFLLYRFRFSLGTNLTIVFTVISAALLFLLQGEREPAIRLWGLALQCVGMATVIADLVGRGSMFNKSNPVGWLIQWVKSFKRRPGAALSVEFSAGLTGSGDATVGPRRIEPGTPIEEQIQIVQANVIRAHEAIVRTRGDLRNERFAREEWQRTEKAERETVTAALRTRLEESMVGSLELAWFGVAWLFVGAILSTAALEFAKHMGPQ